MNILVWFCLPIDGFEKKVVLVGGLHRPEGCKIVKCVYARETRNNWGTILSLQQHTTADCLPRCSWCLVKLWWNCNHSPGSCSSISHLPNNDVFGWIVFPLPGLPQQSITDWGGPNEQNSFHRCGDQKSEVQMSAELFLPRPFSSACRHRSSPWVFPPRLSVQISSSIRKPSHTG